METPSKIRIALFVVALLFVLCFVLKPTDHTAVFQELLAAQAEPSAIDCGIILVGTDSGPGFTCAQEARRTGKGFYLQIQQQGIDSQIADGWLAKQDGDVLFFQYDSDSSGGNRTGTVVYQRTCINPEIAETQIICDGFESTVRIQ